MPGDGAFKAEVGETLATSEQKRHQRRPLGAFAPIVIGDQDDARDRAIVAIGPELDALQDAIDRLRHKRVGGSNVVTWG